jgi:hypothetical protein
MVKSTTLSLLFIAAVVAAWYVSTMSGCSVPDLRTALKQPVVIEFESADRSADRAPVAVLSRSQSSDVPLIDTFAHPEVSDGHFASGPANYTLDVASVRNGSTNTD